jgi:hypothetical protein
LQTDVRKRPDIRGGLRAIAVRHGAFGAADG